MKIIPTLHPQKNLSHTRNQNFSTPTIPDELLKFCQIAINLVIATSRGRYREGMKLKQRRAGLASHIDFKENTISDTCIFY